MFKEDQYDFHLPDNLIASYPAKNRVDSRLLAYSIERNSTSISTVINISKFLKPGDHLVRNITKVEKRRVFACNEANKDFEIMLLSPLDLKRKKWQCLVRGLKKWQEGSSLTLKGYENISITLFKRENEFAFIETSEALTSVLLDKLGNMPIPPYLKRRAEDIDNERYQTTYAKVYGSAAAPTAGLHFSSALTNELKKNGIIFIDLVLHVGYGTFAPLSSDNFKSKKLHKEFYRIDQESAEKLNHALQNKNRVIAVGTTSLRALESNYRKNNGLFKAEQTETDIFLYPPEKINSVNGLLTNFHLPKSSLMMLVSCLTGREQLLSLYKQAIDERMRFFSYGDAMLLLP